MCGARIRSRPAIRRRTGESARGTTQSGDSDPIHQQLTHVGAHQDRPWSVTARVGLAEPAVGRRRLGGAAVKWLTTTDHKLIGQLYQGRGEHLEGTVGIEAEGEDET